jgi:hypothetical protein
VSLGYDADQFFAVYYNESTNIFFSHSCHSFEHLLYAHARPLVGTVGARRVQAVSVRRDASALINPDFYLIIAWFAEHFIAFAFFDVLFRFFIWNAEHFRPKLTALGTHIWIHDKWDAAFIV